MLNVISVDCGRSGVKAVNDSERIYFPSTVGAWRRLRNERRFSVDDYDVVYRDERYYVGRVAAEEAMDGANLMLAYKAHFDTKLATLTAIHRLVDDEAHVMVVTGVPIAFHVDHDKAKMRELLLGDHALSVNGVAKRFVVERVEVAAEGAIVAWSIGRRRKERFHVVDVGSRTVNYVTSVNGRWVDRDSDSLDYGFSTFKGTDAQFARVVIADLSKALRPLGPIVLIGGRESLLSHLRDYHADIELDADALFANANAFHELGVLLRERETAKAAP